MKHIINPVVTAIIGFVLVIFVFALIASIPTWLLWNWLMPPIFTLPEITLLQALGLNILAGILFKSSCKVSKGSSWC